MKRITGERPFTRMPVRNEVIREKGDESASPNFEIETKDRKERSEKAISHLPGTIVRDDTFVTKTNSRN
jgi:hypothetical protein